jgi:DNA topoisomerase-1
LLKQLIHHGIIIPDLPAPLGLAIIIRGRRVQLSPKQEELAMAWARKKDTAYVQDAVFAANFLQDFSAMLGIEPPLTLEEVDFSPCYAVVEAERQAKESMTREERKALAAQRKAEREALKARYGYAIVNGQRVELGNYMSEPSGIFMGRGEHPLRGRWKEGAAHKDVTLNLSPDAPRPAGDWGEIVWQPDSMWVARWEDKLAAKLKYIWLSDTAPIKQQREASKFDKARKLESRLSAVRERIKTDLQSDDPRRRMIATACYLIDVLCLRVGDEKDPDEADTVGATTLRPEHVAIMPDGSVIFHFLGKDSVEWHKTLRPPEVVLDSLRELSANARPSSNANGESDHPTRGKPQLFPDISSRDVNAYLSSIVPGLSAKVFRTHHATRAVEQSLSSAKVDTDSPEHKKWFAATMANLEAAMLCNHTKQATGNWESARERYRQRQERAKERVLRAKHKASELSETLAALKAEAREQSEQASATGKRSSVLERLRGRIERTQTQLAKAREQRSKAQIALDKIKVQEQVAREKRTWNLGTSLKSYVDPRVYHRWGQSVDYDALGSYYPAILQRKFAWVRAEDEVDGDGATTGSLTVRTCLTSDLGAVAELFRAAREACADVDLPLMPEEIGRRYLPALDKEWQEAIIGVDVGDAGRALGFLSLGPVWESDGALAMNWSGVLHPERADAALANLLVDEARRRLQRYQVQHLITCRFVPRDPRWMAWSPVWEAALALDAQEESQSDEDEE